MGNMSIREPFPPKRVQRSNGDKTHGIEVMLIFILLLALSWEAISGGGLSAAAAADADRSSIMDSAAIFEGRSDRF